VVSVVDLRDVAHIANTLAIKQIRKSDRTGKILHILDKDGRIACGFGIDPSRNVDMILVDRHGQLLGRFAGVEQLSQTEAKHRARDAATAPLKPA
jgi:hypothetical protein